MKKLVEFFHTLAEVSFIIGSILVVFCEGWRIFGAVLILSFFAWVFAWGRRKEIRTWGKILGSRIKKVMELVLFSLAVVVFVGGVLSIFIGVATESTQVILIGFIATVLFPVLLLLEAWDISPRSLLTGIKLRLKRSR